MTYMVTKDVEENNLTPFVESISGSEKDLIKEDKFSKFDKWLKD